MPKKVEVRGVVLSVQYSDEDGFMVVPDIEKVEREFTEQGYEVQAISLGIDGCALVEVLS